MKKTILFACVICFNILSATPIFNYTLSDSQKLQSTFSAKGSNGQTIHFAVTKNTDSNMYELLPFVVGNDKTVKKLDAFSSKKMFNILTYHVNNDVLTMLDYREDGKSLIVIDFNLASGANKSVSYDMYKAPENIFQLPGKTILVGFDKPRYTYNIRTITDADHLKYDKIEASEAQKKSFYIHNGLGGSSAPYPEVINQLEYVKHGSIQKRKGYSDGNNLFYTYDDGKNPMKVLSIDLRTNKISTHEVDSGISKATENSGSYLYQDKIVFWQVENSDAKLKVFDAVNGKLVKEISMLNDAKNVISQAALNEYLATALKSSMEPTITINQTKSNQLAVHLGNVKENEYNYHGVWYYNYWFFQQMMIQQQMMMMHMQMSMPRGPQVEDYYSFEIKEPKIYPAMDLVLDTDLNVLSAENQTTLYPDIDQGKYNDKYEGLHMIRYYTSEFTDDEMRYIYQNPRTKEIVIDFDKL